MNTKCQVFTPKNYVNELLDVVNYTQDLYGKKILENSCGDGKILVEIVQRYINDCMEKGISKAKIKNGLERDIYGVEIDSIQYKKCIDNLNCILSKNNISSVEWKIYNEDYLKWNEPIKFHFIIGNPPYIAYCDLEKEEREFIKSSFTTCFTGKFDYCYAFVEKSVTALNKNGKMSYLIPSSIFKTVFGLKLRNYIKPYITHIKDYTQEKIFNKVLVKSAIMVLDKQRGDQVLHYRDITTGKEIDIDITNLVDKWSFAEKKSNGVNRFGDYFKVSNSIATLFNKAYVLKEKEYQEIKEGYICNGYIIEKEIVKDAITPRALRYGTKEKIIFPYKYNNGALKRFNENDFEKEYPKCTLYLKSFINELEKRKSDANAKWYEYGRSQALSKINKEKLIISRIITGNVFVDKVNSDTIPYSGMYIIRRESNKKLSLDDAIKILKSNNFNQYVFEVGIPINGKSVRITSKDIEEYMF